MSEIVMYILCNSNVKMSGGKLAAQVAHSACKIVYGVLERGCLTEKSREDFDVWWRGSYAKIILKSNEEQMKELKKKYPDICEWTVDEGRTEIPKGTLTTLAFVPMAKDEAPSELKSLKLM